MTHSKGDHHHHNSCCFGFTVLLSILLPPLGILVKKGCCGYEFWLCLVLTLLGYLPGIIYAVCIVCEEHDDDHHHHDHNCHQHCHCHRTRK